MRRIAYGLTVAGLVLGSLTACDGGGGGPIAKPGTSDPPTATGTPNGTPNGTGARTISFGEQAGGLTRDHAGETTNQALLQSLNTTPAMTKYGVGKLQGALYGPHHASDPGQLIKIGPGQFLVAAAGGRLDEPRTALSDILKDSTGTTAGGTVTDTDPGPLGGAASCLSLRSGGLKVNTCYWADRTTFGSVTSLTKNVGQTAEQLRKIRADIEKPA
jgi:hypothetical protein